MKNNTLQVILDHWQVKIVCLLLAFCVYFLITFKSTENRTVEIPLNVELPSDYIAESLVPLSITVKIVGPEDIIYLVDPDLISANVDFTNVSTTGISSEVVVLDYDETVFRKGNLSLYTVPSNIRIAFKEKMFSE